jgi:hypothetical protein
MLLQYAYALHYQCLWYGSLVAGILKKLAFTFGPSLNRPSLRHAALAWAAAFRTAPGKPPPWSRTDSVEDHLSVARKELLKKTRETVDEADLFANLFLVLLSVIVGDMSDFATYLRGFMTIVTILNQKRCHRKYHSQLSVFWPLARDLILHAGRYVIHGEPLILEFQRFCNHLITPGLTNCVTYMEALFGFDPRNEYAYSQTVWHYCTILRLCFRRKVFRELGGAWDRDEEPHDIVSQIQRNLEAADVQVVVSDLHRLAASGVEVDMRVDLLLYTLLVHQFCCHLVMLIEAPSIIERAKSVEGKLSARTMLGLLRSEWLKPISAPFTFFPRSVARYFGPRVLWIAGLSFSDDIFSEGIGCLF